jgi:hypothetical protein
VLDVRRECGVECCNWVKAWLDTRLNQVCVGNEMGSIYDSSMFEVHIPAEMMG